MHKTVMLTTAVDYLNPRPTIVIDGSPAPVWYLDATFGAGGHTRELLSRGCSVIALDFDEEAVNAGETNFAGEIKAGKLILSRANFAKLDEVLSSLEISPLFIAGALFDFGTNTDQLMSRKRGFSFLHDAPLDMRLDQRLAVTARDLLMALPESHLARMMAEYGNESLSRAIARAIVQERLEHGQDSFRSSQQLVDLIVRIKDRAGFKQSRGHTSRRLHPATKVFQALRIAVNDEIGNIERSLPKAFTSLCPGGRLVTISFHEGEDRVVKQFAREITRAKPVAAVLLTKKPLTPDETELRQNHRSRSAKMRVVEKI
ncbi:16S rRNA (cytosine(1402)-N(4))-methyltransferase RsmH [Microgenomates group bacterium]|nr:16S rRNA (cytosine(1402)-N(4))-methyltransferase RsmH [Microgenomates group bacterium]